MGKGNVTVLGINGHIGHYAATAFQAAGFSVSGFGRSNRQLITGHQERCREPGRPQGSNRRCRYRLQRTQSVL